MMRLYFQNKIKFKSKMTTTRELLLEDIQQYRRPDASYYLQELISGEPFLFAYCCDIEDGGWWFETINNPTITYENWVYKEYSDEVKERQYQKYQQYLV